MMGTVNHTGSVQLQGGLETEVSYIGNQPHLHDGVPPKKLDTKAQVSFSGWQYSMCIITHHCQEELMLSLTPIGEDKQKLGIWGPTRHCLKHLFHWLILICLLLLK